MDLSILKNPLSYLAIILIAAGLVMIISGRPMKIGSSYSSFWPWPSLLASIATIMMGDDLRPPKPVVMPKIYKKILGGFFVVVGAVLLYAIWITRQTPFGGIISI